MELGLAEAGVIQNKRAQAKAITRARLLEAIVELTATNGEVVTVGDVAQAAGVSPGTFYLHFPSVADARVAIREALVANVCEKALATDDLWLGVRAFVEGVHERALEAKAAV